MQAGLLFRFPLLVPAAGTLKPECEIFCGSISESFLVESSSIRRSPVTRLLPILHVNRSDYCRFEDR